MSGDSFDRLKCGNDIRNLEIEAMQKTLSTSNDSAPKCQELGAYRSLPQRKDSREMVITK